MYLNPSFFHIRYKLFELADGSPSSRDTLSELSRLADKGDMTAQYCIGRYLYIVRPEEDSIDKGFSYLEKAYAQGQADAAAALALAYEEGTCCPMDLDKSLSLLRESLEGGSIYGAISYAYSLICGTMLIEKDLGKAIDVIDTALKLDGLDDELRGYLLYHRAWAKQEGGGADFSPNAYMEAIRLGCKCAWRSYADALCIGDDQQIRDTEQYRGILSEGVKAGDSDCLTMLTYLDSLSAPEGNLDGEKFVASYANAFAMGSPLAAFLAGQEYYNGWDGLSIDTGEAMKWYVKGANFNNVQCLEALYDMADVSHDIDLPEEKLDLIALVGARFGSEKLIGKAVMAYTYGRLTQYAAEIERYYIPIFDREAAHEDSEAEEGPDDDGRYDAYA